MFGRVFNSYPQGLIINGGGGQIRTAEPVGSRFTVYRV